MIWSYSKSINDSFKSACFREYIYPVLSGFLVIANDEVSFDPEKDFAVPLEYFKALYRTVWAHLGVEIIIKLIASNLHFDLLFHNLQSIQKLLNLLRDYIICLNHEFSKRNRRNQNNSIRDRLPIFCDILLFNH